MAQYQTVSDESTLARFSGSSRVKQNTAFLGVGIYKLSAADLKVNRIYSPLREPILWPTTRFNRLSKAATLNGPAITPASISCWRQ
jgi:hypothetical protein